MVLRSTAFRIWVLFTLIGLAVSIPLAYYFKKSQATILKEHTQSEFRLNARITASAVETALDLDDFGVLTSLLKEIEKDSIYSFIALIEKDKFGNKSVFACSPERFKDQVLDSNNDKYYLFTSNIRTEVLSGQIVIGTPIAYDMAVREQINMPIVYLTVLAVLGSIILFGLSIYYLSKPIFSAVLVAKQLGERNYSVPIEFKAGTSEMTLLNNALFNLKTDLSKLELENNDLTTNLQHRIDSITLKIEAKTLLSKLLLDVSREIIENPSKDVGMVVCSTLEMVCGVLDMREVLLISSNSGKIKSYSSLSNSKIHFDAIEPYLEEFSLFLNENPNLITLHREDNSAIRFLEVLFIEYPELKTTTIFSSKEEFNTETIVLLSKGSFNEFDSEEIAATLNIYFSLISNYRKGVEAQEEMSNLNRNLELKVLEKTRVNLEISNTLVAQEKLSAVGELAAGLAHDLNTPLASINASVQSLPELITQFLSVLKELNEEDRALVFDNGFFESGVKVLQSTTVKRKITKELIDYFNAHEQEKYSELATFFADCGISVQNEKLITRILECDQPKSVLLALQNHLVLLAFIQNITLSSERASQVVMNLSRFMREDLTQKREIIFPQQSISIVVALSRYRLKGTIRLELLVPEDLRIRGVEMKLFQVWMNLIKNAIDALESAPDVIEKTILIRGWEEHDQVIITFENNGPKIPEDLQHKIFKKFFTTKQAENGTGLGLNIISNIMQEHYGSISLSSSDEKTIFTLHFPKAEEPIDPA